MRDTPWYYADAHAVQQGPVSADTLRGLAARGAINRDTLVWRDGLDQWVPLSDCAGELGLDLARPPSPPGPPMPPPTAAPPSSPAAAAAPTSAPADGAAVVQAGFWRRFAALFVDSLVISGLWIALMVPLALAFAAGTGFSAIDEDTVELLVNLAYFVTYPLLSLGYFAGMESSRHQATVGKLALGIKVVDLRGERLRFGHAAGRWAASLLSYLTLYIGFMMAGWTRGKQGLHDLVAGTQVVDRWAYTDHPERQSQGLGGCAIAIMAGALLLVLVSVLGILAAIAIPAYQHYVQRAQVASALVKIAPLKAGLAEYVRTQGACPGSGDLDTAAVLGPPLASLEVGPADEDGDCPIVFTLDDPTLDGLRVWETWLMQSGEWVCYSEIADARLPERCRG